MIFVTVGTRPEPFTRLIAAADMLAGWIDEEIVVQYGSAAFHPLHATGVPWMDEQTFRTHMLAARAVVSHAGAGTIILALKYGRPLVVVPRSAAWKESVDDHQYELAQALHVRRQAFMLEDLHPITLWDAITYVAAQPVGRSVPTLLRKGLSDQLAAWDRGARGIFAPTGKKG